MVNHLSVRLQPGLIFLGTVKTAKNKMRETKKGGMKEGRREGGKGWKNEWGRQRKGGREERRGLINSQIGRVKFMLL